LPFNGRSATVPHSKGLADIVRLLADPGTDIHVLDVIDAADRSSRPGAVTDRQALDAYRRRLAEIESEADEARHHNDEGRARRLDSTSCDRSAL
jgi:hypothetical protein